VPKQRWYHWLVLVLVVSVAASVGILDLAMGASADSPYFMIDDLAIRAIGAAFVISVVLVLLRRRFGFRLAFFSFLLSAMEVVSTWALGQTVPGWAVAAFVVASIAFAGASLWLSRVFAKPAPGA
jgi:hypothetical protein